MSLFGADPRYDCVHHYPHDGLKAGFHHTDNGAWVKKPACMSDPPAPQPAKTWVDKQPAAAPFLNTSATRAPKKSSGWKFF
jgi:hypothetical protein